MRLLFPISIFGLSFMAGTARAQTATSVPPPTARIARFAGDRAAAISYTFDDNLRKTHIGQPALTLAFPFNQSTPEVQAAALKYHLAYRSHQASTGGKSTVASLNEWADKLVKEKKWDIMMTHAIAKGYAAMSDPEIFHAHLKYVKDRERDIWGDTFANVARYEKERDDAKLTVAGTVGRITCTITGSLDSKLYDVPLTIVVDAPGVVSAHAERAGRELPARVFPGGIQFDAAPDKEPVTVVWK